MLALRSQDNQLFLDRNADEPMPGPGTALLAMRLTMIDPTDLAIARRDTSFEGIIGRRAVASVRSLGEGVRSELASARVVPEIDLADPTSDLAKRGLAAHDPSRRILGLRSQQGMLAELATLPGHALTPVPDAVSDKQAVFAAPVADAIHAARLLRLDTKSFVSVIGDSLESLLTAQVMARHNHSVRLVAVREDRLELCERWGVRRRHLDEAGRRADQDVIVASADHPEHIQAGIEMLRPRGTLLLLAGVLPTPGRRASQTRLDASGLIEHELTVRAARNGTVRVGLQAIADGSVDLQGLISHQFTLADAMAAVRAAADPDALAVVVKP